MSLLGEEISILICTLSSELFIRLLLNADMFIVSMLVFCIDLSLLNVDTVAYVI